MSANEAESIETEEGNEIEDDDGPVHPVRAYFTYDPLTGRSKCVTAGQSCKLKNNAILGKHVGNLRRHLKRQHSQAFAAVVKDEVEYRLQLDEHRKLKKAARKKKPVVGMTSHDIKMDLVRLVAVRGRPLKLMDDPEFQSLTSHLTGLLPPGEKITINSENVRGFCVEHAEDVRKKISEELRGRLVSLKVDSCTKGKRPFFAINCQFIEQKAVQIRTLRVAEMLTSQTSKNLKTEVLLTASDFSIKTPNIYTITADNGGNMKLAARLIGDEQEETIEAMEDLNVPDLLVLDSEEVGLPGWDSTVHQGCPAADHRCQCIRCAAHTLQLAVEYALAACPGSLKTIAEVRKMAVKLRTVTARRQLSNANLAVPSLDNATRWNTKDDMLRSVRSLKDFIENVFIDSEKDLLQLDWDAVDTVIECLAPAKVATTKLQAEQLLLGDFLCIWMTCKADLKKLKQHELAKQILKQMDKQAESAIYTSGEFKGQEKTSSLFDYPVILAAIFMDPRFFTFLNEEQRNIAKSHLEKLWVRIQRAKRAENDDEESETEDMRGQHGEDSETTSDSENEFLAGLKENDNERVNAASAPTANVAMLLDKYYHETKMLNRKANVLDYWYERRKTHPELYELSCVALAVPATQVSVERLFSSLSFMLDPLRTKLASSFVDDLLVIRNNAIFMEKDKRGKKRGKEKPLSESSSSTD